MESKDNLTGLHRKDIGGTLDPVRDQPTGAVWGFLPRGGSAEMAVFRYGAILGPKKFVTIGRGGFLMGFSALKGQVAALRKKTKLGRDTQQHFQSSSGGNGPQTDALCCRAQRGGGSGRRGGTSCCRTTAAGSATSQLAASRGQSRRNGLPREPGSGLWH